MLLFPLGSGPLGSDGGGGPSGTVTPLTIGAQSTPTYAIVSNIGKNLLGSGINTDSLWSNVTALLRFEGADGSTTFTDDKGHTFTATGDAQLDNTQTVFGATSGLFDGTGDALTTPDHSDFDLSGALGVAPDATMEATIWLSELGRAHTICSKRSSAGSGNFSFQVNASNKLIFQFYYSSGSSGSVVGATTLEQDKWYHVAAERQGTTMRVYVNGVLDGTATQTNVTDANNLDFCIGRAPGSTPNYFKGLINQFRFTKGVARYGGSSFANQLTLPYGSAPTHSIIRDNGKPFLGWGANNDPYWSNVVALHRFEGADGSTSFIDTGPTARTYTTNGNAQLDDAQAVHGLTSGLFDGTGDFLTTPDQLDFRASQAGDFTVEAVIKLSVIGKVHTICCKRAASGSAGEFTFNVDSNNKVNLQIFNINPWTAIGATTLAADVWYRVAAEREGTTLRVYVDGVVDGTGTQSGTPLSTTATFNIGRSLVNTTRDFQGWINEFRMTRVARYQGNSYDFRPPAGGKYYSIAKSTGHVIDRQVNPTFTNLVKKTTAWAINRVVDPTYTAIRRTFLPRSVIQDNNPPSFAYLPNKNPTAMVTTEFSKQSVLTKFIKTRTGPRKGDGSMPTFVGVGTIDISSSQTTATPWYPAGIQKDDVAIYSLMWTDAIDDPTPPYASDPAGWTRFLTHSTSSGWAVFWYKRLIGNETGSVSASATSGTSLGVMAGSISVWRGCDTEFEPFEALDWKQSGNTAPNTGNAAFTLGPNRRVVTWFQNLSDGSVGVPADGSTKHLDQGSTSGNDGCHAIYSLPAPDAGTVYGPIQRTVAGGSGSYIAVTFALKPTPEGGSGVGGGIDEVSNVAVVNKGIPYLVAPGLKTTKEAIELVNPGFETGDATGWALIYGDNVQVRTNGDDGVTSHGGGTYYGAGSATAAAAWWGQTVSLSSDYHTYIDAGVVTAKFSAWHAGFTDTDNGALMVECFNGSGAWLSDIRADFSDPASWENEYLQVRIPVGTRSIRVSTQNIRITGTQLSSYWDDFELLIEGRSNPCRRHDLIVSEYGNSTAGWTTTIGTLNSVTSTAMWNYPILYGLNSAALATYKDFTFPSDTHTNIDAGHATMEMVCHLGRGTSQSDAIRVWIECLDASDTILGTIETSPTEVLNPTYWTCFKGTMPVPVLTRKFRVRYTGTLTSGGNIDGYLSRLSVFLRAADIQLPMLSNHAEPAVTKLPNKTFNLAAATSALLVRMSDRVISFGMAVDAFFDKVIQTDGETYPVDINASGDSQAMLQRDTAKTALDLISTPVTSLARSTSQLFNRTSDVALSLVRSTTKPFIVESKGQPLVYSYGAHRYWRIRAPETNNSSGYLGFTKVKLRASPGGTDLANGRTANASAIHGSYPPSNATDSNGSTFWTTVTAAAPAGGHWFSVDLGSGNDAEIVEVALTSRPDGFNEWPLYFVVEYSDNNSTWTSAWTPETWSTSWGNGVEKVFGRTAIPPAGYRYWRVRSSDTAVSGEYLGLATVEMYEGGMNRAGVATITASAASGSYPVRNTIDSNASSFWTTGAVAPPGGGHWIKFDFILPRNISETRLTVRPDAFREDPLNVYVEYSSDNTNWTTKWSQTGLSGWSASEQRTFTDASPVNYDIPNVFFSKSIGRIVDRTVDAVSGQFRQFGKVAVATADTASNLAKSTGKAIGSTIDAIATMAKDFITGVTNYDRTFDASSNVEMVTIKSTTNTANASADVSANRLSLPGKVLTATSNMSMQVIKSTNRAFQLLADGVGSRVFSLARTTTVTTEGQSTSDASKTLLVAVNSTISAVTSTARSAGKLVNRAVDASVSSTKAISSNITQTVAGIPGALKSVPKVLGSISFTASTVRKETSRDLSVDADIETATSKQTITTLVAPVAAITYVGRGVNRTFASIVDATASAAKQIPLTISSTTSSVVNSVVTALTGAPIISNAIAYVEATFDIQIIPGRGKGRASRGGGVGTFESAASVRRRNAELERERERKRLDEEQQRVTFTMSFNGKVVTKTYDIDESIVQTSINIRESIAKAVVAIKSIFIRKKDTTIAPVVRIKDDRD